VVGDGGKKKNKTKKKHKMGSVTGDLVIFLVSPRPGVFPTVRSRQKRGWGGGGGRKL